MKHGATTGEGNIGIGPELYIEEQQEQTDVKQHGNDGNNVITNCVYWPAAGKIWDRTEHLIHWSFSGVNSDALVVI